MCVYIYIYLSLSTYIYIYTCICVYIYIYIYIYTHIHMTTQTFCPSPREQALHDKGPRNRMIDTHGNWLVAIGRSPLL